MRIKVYNGILRGEWYYCGKCCEMMLLPPRADRCPECGGEGCLEWACDAFPTQLGEKRRVGVGDLEEVGLVEYTGRTLKARDYMTKTNLLTNKNLKR